MQVNGLIVEELNENGDLKSFVLNKDYQIGNLWIAFPEEFDSPRNGPVHFLSDAYEKLFDSVYKNHKIRKVKDERLKQLDKNTFEFFTNWDNIPVKAIYEIYYYALHLPKYAIPITMNISVKRDEYDKNDRIEKIVKDKDRYIVYIPCKGLNGTSQNLKLQIVFEISEEKFKNQEYREIEVITNKEFLKNRDLIHNKIYSKYEQLLELVESGTIKTMPKIKLSELSNTQKIKILFVSADPINASNPIDSSRIRIDEEYREIKESIERSKQRDKFDLQTITAVRVKDLRREMLRQSPEIVHFSGHGAKEGICLEDENGNTHLVPKDSLSNFFEQFKNCVKCVILNACYSKDQAEGISENIEYVIGMNDEIGDRAAILFSTGFYDALGSGKSIEDAFKLGINAIEMNNINGSRIPELIKRDSVQK